MKNIALNYFKAFASKDIPLLRSLYSDDVALTDWEINAVGIDAVISANQDIFMAVESLEVNPIRVYMEGNSVVSELEIKINRSNTIKVVDVIDINDHGKITAIRAYKG